MPPLSKSARLYQERRLPDDRTTRRLPSLRTNMSVHPLHRYPVTNLYPSPEQSTTAQPPDAGHSNVWPNTRVEEIIGGSETS